MCCQHRMVSSRLTAFLLYFAIAFSLASRAAQTSCNTTVTLCLTLGNYCNTTHYSCTEHAESIHYGASQIMTAKVCQKLCLCTYKATTFSSSSKYTVGIGNNDIPFESLSNLFGFFA
jgi:hypothetical protein